MGNTRAFGNFGNIKCFSQDDLINAGCFNYIEVIEICERALIAYSNGDVIYPDKLSVTFNEEFQSRINCLPAGFKSKNIFGAKWVSVFPQNPSKYNLPNVNAVIILSELVNGLPFAIIDATMLTNIRTAAMSAIAAKNTLSIVPKEIGLIGSGEQAKSHFIAMKTVFPSINICKVSSKSEESLYSFIDQMKRYYPSVKFVSCKNLYEKAVENADIIVTAISGQEKLLQANWIKEGNVFYAHVGGIEDDYAVAKKSSKIICDDWHSVKGRKQTISLMYHEGVLNDDDIYANLYEIVSGFKEGKHMSDNLIYYNGVGLSYIDVAVAYWAYNKALEKEMGVILNFSNKSMFDYNFEELK